MYWVRLKLDIKNAIMAASIIVNFFKITNYQMLVYGSTTKDLDYTTECKGSFCESLLHINLIC